ncbi:hypothetical protein KCU89_g710, partial [Aureobasidium melanogenum]
MRTALLWLTMIQQLLLAFTIAIVAYVYLRSERQEAPLIHHGTSFSFLRSDAKHKFVTNSKALMAAGRNAYPDQPYRILTDVGEVVVLPPHFADEILNSPALSLARAMEVDFHGDIPGFQLTSLQGANYQLVQTVSRKQLTRSLSTLIDPLSDETRHALFLNLGQPEAWKEVVIRPIVVDLVARVSSRVFLGKELSRNPKWLRITKSYTMNMFIAATELRMYPCWTRRFVHWVLPRCRDLRGLFNEARETIEHFIKEREQLKNSAQATEDAVPIFNDAIEWAATEARAENVAFDEAKFQLAMSVAAIHTTADLLTQVILDLAKNPDTIIHIREEIQKCLRAHGWTKAAFYNMQLCDSVIKESQRLKPASIASMRRRVEHDMVLSSGFKLKKGTRINIDAARMWDPQLYEEPLRWIPDRFLKMRTTGGQEQAAQLVSTSPDHLAFGHGQHACPGRFFATIEIKIALCHLVLGYEWKLVPGSSVAPIINGISAIASPSAKVAIRRKEENACLD